MQQSVYGTKICNICDLQKCLTQTWVDIEQNVIEAAINQWHDRLRSWHVRAGAGHFEHMLWNYCLFALCGSSEHFWNCQCNLVHLTAVSMLTLKDEFMFTCMFGVSNLTR